MLLSRTLCVATVAAGLAAGCATVPVPHEQMAAAQGAIRAAEEMGAEKVPPAALNLQLAKTASDEAQKLIQRDENIRASLRLQRAEADADLALSRAREVPARADAQKAIEQLQALKQKAMP